MKALMHWTSHHATNLPYVIIIIDFQLHSQLAAVKLNDVVF